MPSPLTIINYPQGVQWTSPTSNAHTYFTFDRLAADANTGAAQFLFEPDFTPTNVVGVFVRPHTIFATLATASNQFLTAYSLKFGNHDNGVTTNQIPAGTKGGLGGVDANIDTSQTSTDIALNESGHGFGATIVLSGSAGTSTAGAFYAGLDVDLTIVRNPGIPGTPSHSARAVGAIVNICNSINEFTDSQQIGYYALSLPAPNPFDPNGALLTPTYNSYAAFLARGDWYIGLDLQGHNIQNATTLGFATPGSSTVPSSDTNYKIDGSSTTFLQIFGGGNGDASTSGVGGIAVYGTYTTTSTAAGLILFRPNRTVTTNFIILNAGTGDAFFAGTVSMRTYVLSSDERLKSDISDFTDGIEFLKKLPGLHRFTYNGAGGLPAGVQDVGFTAQEVLAIAPDWIDTFQASDPVNGLSTYYGVKYNYLLLLLYNAMREIISRFNL